MFFASNVASKAMTRFGKNARVLLMAVVTIALCSSSVQAQQPQPPSARCRPASKIEYNSAKQHYLLQNRFGTYVRTGRFWRHHYWYCRQ
jgi:hypothetical protein